MLSHGTKHVTGKVKENYAKQVDDAKGGREKSKGKLCQAMGSGMAHEK